MKKQYEYIEMVEVTADSVKTKRFAVMNRTHGYALGEIGWSPPWRQYIFKPFSDTIFSAGCLKDIIDFIEELQEERRNSK